MISWLLPHLRPILLAATLTLGAGSAAAQDVRAPEAATGTSSSRLASASKHMVSAANPLAAAAGRDMLRAGGSAIDAAIATQLVLGLVEPQSSGLGGGAFILNWDQGKKELKTYDGREAAPKAATPDRFLKDGAPLEFDAAVKSDLSVGVPGLVKLLEYAHQRHGKLPWAKLFEPAIKLAEDGFPVSPRLSLLLAWNGPESLSPAARNYFFDERGSARPKGFFLKNPDYAATLKAIAAEGAKAFYEGPITDAIVAALPTSGMTKANFESYRVQERGALCYPYRKKKICSMGPPSSGGTAVAQILKLVEPFPETTGPGAAMTRVAMHLVIEAEKLAYADRNRYLADPDFVSIPATLIDDSYIAERRKLIGTSDVMEKPAAGVPPGLDKRAFGTDATHEAAGTSHISVIDGNGNAVAMTTTIESAFGSGRFAAGFLLNNELTDFSFLPVDRDGTPIANRVEGGKRPRSSMAPTIVFDDKGEVEMVLGSPGGSRIIMFVAKALVALIDWEMDAASAIAASNFGSDGGPAEIEVGLSAPWHGLKLKLLGHKVKFDLLTSGTHIVMRRNGRLEGAADPRREGAALGD